MNFNLNSTKNNFSKNFSIESDLILDFSEKIEPMVSIMIPTFKRPHLLKEAIDSAVNQQTKVRFEIVVVDNDADKEFEAELLTLIGQYNQYNIKYYRNSINIGMFGNWNRCIELARSKWYSILNDDDILNVDWLDSVYSQVGMKKMIITGYKKVSSSKEIIEYLSNYNLSRFSKVEKINFRHFFSSHQSNGTLGVLMEKDKSKQVGGFDEDLFPTSDYNFSFLYWYKYGACRVCKELCLFRWEENESMKTEVMRGHMMNDFHMWRKYGDEIFRSSVVKRKLIEFTSYMLTIKKSKYFSSINNDFDRNQELKNNFKHSSRISRFLVDMIPYRLILIMLCFLDK